MTSEVQDEQVAAGPERWFRPLTSARGAFSGWPTSIYVDARATRLVETGGALRAAERIAELL